MKKLFLLLLLALTAYSPWALAQSVTLANDGVYVSRMTTSQRNAITAPTTGQLIYNTEDGCFNVYQQNVWKKLCGSETKELWITKATFNEARRHKAVGFSIGNKGYIGLGYSYPGGFSNDFWEFDGNIWTQKVAFGGEVRYTAVGFSISGKGYIGTGWSGSSFLKDFWEFDPISNMWTKKPDFGGVAREQAVGFSLNGKGYIGTGRSSSGRLKDFWEFDPISNMWTKKPDFGGVARSEAVGFSLNGKGYIGTGYSPSSGRLNDFWEYNPADSSWTKKADVGGEGRDGAVGFAINSKGYIGTGYSNSTGYLNDFWEFDGNIWTQKAAFGGTGRHTAVGFSINGKGYIGTGYSNSTSYLNDFWEYDTEASVVTQQGNSFNTASQLLQLDGSAKVPVALLPTTVTQQGNTINAANGLLKLDASAQVPLATLPTTVTQLGNSFNGANQLLKLDGSAKVPVATLPGSVTQLGNTINVANGLLQLDGSTKLPEATLPTTVTQQGNTINAANGLLKLGSDGRLPVQFWVGGSQPFVSQNHYFMDKDGTGKRTNNTVSALYSIVSENRISAAEFNAYSDARIKTIMGRSDAENDLHLLQQLKITDYVYKDKLRYGNNTYKKVVAQEVEAVYPQAVSRKTDFIPDIYQKAKSRLLSASVMELALDTVVVWQVGQKLKLISTKGEEVIAEVTESGEGNRVRLKSSAAGASEWFVYGRQVDDFRAVDYEALSMLHLSATQQLLRKIQVLEKQVQAVEQLKKDNEWMKEQLQLIKAHLLPSSAAPITAEAKP